MTITFEQLKKDFGDKAGEIWREVCAIGGFGHVPAEHTGGLDCSGLSPDAKKAVQAAITKKEGK